MCEMSFSKDRIIEIAMRQSAIDAGCEARDFMRAENITVISSADRRARKYLELPFDCNLISYGSNIVASVGEGYVRRVSEYISRFSIEKCFETPGLYVLNDAFLTEGLRACFMAEYFLPDSDELSVFDCGFELRVLEKGEFDALYTDEWSNALCKKRRELDMLCVGAYDGERLIGLAGCSADCDSMWQIGIDVLPAYRRHGVASALTSHLAAETFKRGKVPFYCAAWSNIASVRNAINCGFRPAWVELTYKSIGFTDSLNSGEK